MALWKSMKFDKTIRYTLIASIIITSTAWAVKGIKPPKMHKWQIEAQAQHEANIQKGLELKQKLDDEAMARAAFACKKGQIVQICPYCMHPAPFPGHNGGNPKNTCGNIQP